MADTTLAELLDQALVDRDERRWKTIAFVHRHEISAALSSAQPAPVEQDVEPAEAVRRVSAWLKVSRMMSSSNVDVMSRITGEESVELRRSDIELLVSTLTPARAEGWLPIESAPKDGKPLDLWVYSPAFVVGGARSTDARWLDGAWREPVEWDDDGDQYEYFDGVGHTIRVETELCKATHWMRVNPPTLGSVDHG